MIGLTKTTDHTNGITREGEFKLAFECSYSRTGQIIDMLTILSFVYSLN